MATVQRLDVMRDTARLRRILSAWGLIGILSWNLPVGAMVLSQLEFIGEARLAAGRMVDGAPIGGLSGLTYDAERDLFYVVSDDPSGRAPARFFSLKLDLSAGSLDDSRAQIVGMTVIQDPAGGPMPELSVDPEGIALAADGSLFISSEGQIRQQVAPFIRRYSRDGVFLGEVPLPVSYRPSADRSSGPRHNFGFEGLSLTPDQRYLFAVTENALVQDGPAAAWQVSSPSRLLKFSASTGELVAEYVYRTEPLAAQTTVAEGMEVAGVVELLAVDDSRLLAMERSFSMGVGNSIRLFQIDLAEATDVSRYPALSMVDAASLRPVEKRLLLDLEALGIYLDNLEGMALGGPLPDGRRSLVLVADDNFNPLIQVSQILAFAVDDTAVTIESIQGAGHRSPLAGRWVYGVTGVVTGLQPGEAAGFWIEDPAEDGDPATSRGVQVSTAGPMPEVSVGDAVELAGRVEERRRSEGELPTTTLKALEVRRLPETWPVPPAVRLGEGGRRIPTEVIEDDGLVFFDPAYDGLDFWESLEGMRVRLSRPTVIGPTNRFGELVIQTGPWPPAEGRSVAGGLRLRPGDANPERLIVGFAKPIAPPSARVGDAFDGDLQGIVLYDFGSYRLLAEAPVPAIRSSNRMPEASTLAGGDRLTIATFNVYNLSARSAESRFERLARDLVDSLGSPDILALQEIQDDSGPEDDGTVGAEQTLTRLVRAVQARGGPAYRFRQIDPADGSDGGYPGANIRVAFLFDPERVGFEDRSQGAGEEAVRVLRTESGARLSANPARLASGAAAFADEPGRGFTASRKPLVGEFTFGERRLFLINLHLRSKSGDDRLFGEVQPPERHSEDQRSQQARLVADFVGELLATDPGANVLVLGDLNEHEFRPPLRILGHAALTNPVEQLAAEDRYTFVHNGNSQMLDHVLVSPSVVARADLHFDIVHLNADFAHDERSSDHDPIVIDLGFR